MSEHRVRIIPVIDLKDGQVVRAVGGHREEYAPIESCLLDSSEPFRVAQAMREAFGCESMYVADIDALSGRSPAFRDYDNILSAGVRVMVDAGVTDLERARELTRFAERHAGLESLIVGLESVASADVVGSLAAEIGAERTVFSLDLYGGELWRAAPAWQGRSPNEIALEVASLGIGQLIVLDLADVGGGQGPQTLPLCRDIRARLPRLQLIAGGGIRSAADVSALAAAGCDAALVSSALHNGSLTQQQIHEHTWS